MKFEFAKDAITLDTGIHGPGYGFMHEGVFITDPRTSSCGRFAVSPEVYGLTPEQADELLVLNAQLDWESQ